MSVRVKNEKCDSPRVVMAEEGLLDTLREVYTLHNPTHLLENNI